MSQMNSKGNKQPENASSSIRKTWTSGQPSSSLGDTDLKNATMHCLPTTSLSMHAGYNTCATHARLKRGAAQ
eukprot:1160182-Pelagomonas_calceolata.AAC.2